jgi:hypothetical protein
VEEDVLPITGAKSKFSNEWKNFIGDSCNFHFLYGFGSELVDKFISVCLILKYNLFYSCWLNAFIKNEGF